MSGTKHARKGIAMVDLHKPEVKKLIKKRDWDALRTLAESWPMPELADLLEEYAAGSLYMSKMLAKQSRPQGSGTQRSQERGEGESEFGLHRPLCPHRPHLIAP